MLLVQSVAYITILLSEHLTVKKNTLNIILRVVRQTALINALVSHHQSLRVSERLSLLSYIKGILNLASSRVH